MNRDLFAAAGGVVDATTDPYFNSTTLLLSGDGTNGAQNNTFVDSSANNATITRAGSPTQGSFSPFSQTGWSGYFTGSSYLTTPSSAATNFSGVDWTIETWIYPTSAPPADVTCIIQSLTGTNNWIAYINLGLMIDGRITTALNAVAYTTTQTISFNTWSHLALVRSGGVVKLYINGVASSVSVTTDIINSNLSFFIGKVDNSSVGGTYIYYFPGYISNLRFTKGTAVYTGNFTPPTAPLTATQAAGTNIAEITGTSTSLLTLQDNRFKDNALTPNTITVAGTPSIQAFSPFAPTAAYSLPAAAAGSAYFNGSSQLTCANNAAFAFFTSNFTVECWLYPLSSGGQSVMNYSNGQSAGQNFAWEMYQVNGTTIQFGIYDSDGASGYNASNTTLSINKWNHIAVVRNGNTMSLYVNGVVGGTTVSVPGVSVFNKSAATLKVSGYNNATYQYTGYVSNLRIVKGTAVYTGNFIPSGTPLSKIQSAGTNIAALSGTETSILTLQDSTFKDNSVNVATITASSPAPVIQSFTPFTQVWGGYFAGTSTYLQLSNIPIASTGAFTIEGWMYPTSSSTLCMYSQYLPGSVDTGRMNFLLNDIAGKISISTGAGANGYLVSTSSVSLNTWTHFALVRDGSNVAKIYINGLLDATNATFTSTIMQTTAYIGYTAASPGFGFNGYISNFRITNTAVYTGAFTPPAKTLSATQAAGTNISAITGTATSLLTLQDPTFKDNATLPNTITAAGTPKTQLVSAPFTSAATVDPVNGSAYFDGTGDYLTVPANSAFDLGTGNFTIECWLYYASTPPGGGGYDYLWGLGSTGVNGLGLYVQYAGLKIWNGSSILSTSGTISATTWYHIAVVKNSSTLTVYLNGTSIGSVAFSSNLSGGGSSGFNIARWSNFPDVEDFYGYISNFRIVKGTAVYTAAFTPPSAPLTAITNTSLLTLQDTTFIDNSTNAAVITASGTPVMRAFTPFTQAWGGYFDGTSNLTVPASSQLTLGAGDYTIECWFNITGAQSTTYGWGIAGTYDGASNGGWSLGVNRDTGVYGIDFIDNNAHVLTYGTYFLTNTWYHLALVKSGSSANNLKAYVNGIQVSAVTYNTADTTVATCYIGSQYTGQKFPGYISNLRITKDVAVYTGTFTPPAKTLSATQAAGTNISAIYPGQTSLLTLQDPTFKDNAAISNTITAVGTPKMQLISSLPFTSSATVDPVNGSGYFDGSSYVSAPSNAAFGFGTGDFTIEGWFYFTGTIGTYQRPWWFGDDNDNLEINSSVIRYGGASLTVITGSTALANIWYHIAYSRQSGSGKLFINGTQVGSTTASSYSSSTRTFTLMATSGGANPSTGYVSNFRIVKGTAVYTAAFQPPTAPLTAIANTSLLTLQDTTFKDNSTNALAITAAGSPSMRAFTPFASNWGGYFNGTSDYLTIPSSVNTAFSSSTTFTLDMWLYPTAYAPGTAGNEARTVMSTSNVYPEGWRLDITTTGISWYTYTNAGAITTTLTLNKWTHFVVTHDGTTTKLYKDGILVGSAATTWSAGISSPFYIGALNSGAYLYPYQGYISNLRIVKGTAVYTTNFTPPSAPLTAITNTSLLTLQNNTFIDNSSNIATITPSGAPKTQLLQLPFTSSITKVAAPWSVYQVTKVAAPWNISVTAPLATVGGSMYFDGSSYLSVPPTSNFAFGTGDFTVECYIYGNSTTFASGGICSPNVYNGGSLYWAILAAGGNVTWQNSHGNTNLFSVSAVAYYNTWLHITVVRSSGTTKMYFNGVQVASAADSNNYVLTTTYVIARNGDGPYNMGAGYLSNLRIVKGTAVYTAAFTPPTAPPQPTQTPGLLGSNVNAIDGTNSSLLLLGSNAGIYDATAKNDLVTVGNAQVSSTQIKYGTGAMYFDGTGDYLTIPTSQFQNYNFKTEDFTIECWLYQTAFSGDTIIIASITTWASSVNFYFGTRAGSPNILIFRGGDSVPISINGNTGITANVWTHLAVSRASGVTRMFVGGILQTATHTGSVNISNTTQAIGIGAANNGTEPITGYIDDLRITKYARYTTNFTPPTKAMIGQ